jgi:Glyoxalase-like domain
MDSMLLDHLSYAAGPEGARTAAAELGRLLGAEFADGGFHPRFGTRNFTLALSAGRYIEVVEVLDHPAADKAVFGQVVRARSAEGGGWLGWVVAVEDMAEVELRIGRQAIEGHRHLPDETRLEWLQLGVRGLQCDPQLPFFVQWLSDPAVHPSAGGGRIDLLAVEIAGSQSRVDDWLGGSAEKVLADIPIEWVAPRGQPGLIAATFGTPSGVVRI